MNDVNYLNAAFSSLNILQHSSIQFFFNYFQNLKEWNTCIKNTYSVGISFHIVYQCFFINKSAMLHILCIELHRAISEKAFFISGNIYISKAQYTK